MFSFTFGVTYKEYKWNAQFIAPFLSFYSGYEFNLPKCLFFIPVTHAICTVDDAAKWRIYNDTLNVWGL